MRKEYDICEDAKLDLTCRISINTVAYDSTNFTGSLEILGLSTVFSDKLKS